MNKEHVAVALAIALVIFGIALAYHVFIKGQESKDDDPFA